MRDRVAQTQDKLLKWSRNLNPGLHTKQCRILNKQPELKDWRLTLLIDQDSLSAIKRTGYMIFTRLSQVTVKVLKDPEAQPQKEEWVMFNTASSELFSKGEGADIPTLSDDQKRTAETEE
jgi:hypothetical protein